MCHNTVQNCVGVEARRLNKASGVGDEDRRGTNKNKFFDNNHFQSSFSTHNSQTQEYK